jgi:WD40 repeat protein
VAAPVVVQNPGAGAAVGPSLPPTVVLPAIDRAEALAISPDGGLLAAGIRAGTIVLWDLRTGREARRMAGHTAQVACLAEPVHRAIV